MTEQQQFLAIIRANPDEDTHRLVYADWLQENGEEDRAEMIRLSVRDDLVRMGDATGPLLHWRERESCSTNTPSGRGHTAPTATQTIRDTTTGAGFAMGTVTCCTAEA